MMCLVCRVYYCKVLSHSCHNFAISELNLYLSLILSKKFVDLHFYNTYEINT